MPYTLPNLRFANQGAGIHQLRAGGSAVTTAGSGAVTPAGSVVELAVARAVQEALPLVPVEHEHPLSGIPRHPHQDPLRAFPGAVLGAGEGDFEGAVAAAGALPGLRGEVDAEVGDRGLGGHGFLATPQ